MLMRKHCFKMLFIWLLAIVIISPGVHSGTVSHAESVTHLKIPTTLRRRDDQPAELNDTTWLYYALYTFDEAKRGDSISVLLEDINTKRVYYKDIIWKETSVALVYTDTISSEIFLTDGQSIDKADLVISCPIHQIQYRCPIDLDFTQYWISPVMKNNDVRFPKTASVSAFFNDQTLSQCLHSTHEGIFSSVTKSLLNLISRITERATNRTDHMEQCSLPSVRTEHMEDNEKEVWKWYLIQGRTDDSSCILRLANINLSFNENQEIFTVSVTPSYTSDLFESEYMWNEAAIKEKKVPGQPMMIEYVGALVDPGIVLSFPITIEQYE